VKGKKKRQEAKRWRNVKRVFCNSPSANFIVRFSPKKSTVEYKERVTRHERSLLFCCYGYLEALLNYSGVSVLLVEPVSWFY